MAARGNRGSSRDIGEASAGATGVPVGGALVIGRIDSDVEEALRQSHGSLVVCAFASLERALLDRVSPRSVVCPLMAEGFEALQVLTLLRQAGYAGDVMVVAPPLPDPRMVERELRAVAPGLRVTLILTGVG